MLRPWCVAGLAMLACDTTPPPPPLEIPTVECEPGTTPQCIAFDGLGPIPPLPEGTRCSGGTVAQCMPVACVGDDDCDVGELCQRDVPDAFGRCEIAAIRLIRIRAAPEVLR